MIGAGPSACGEHLAAAPEEAGSGAAPARAPARRAERLARRPGLDLSVGQRLALGFGAAGVLLALLVGLSLAWVQRVAELRAQLEDVIAPREQAAEQLENAIFRAGLAARNLALSRAPQDAAALRQAGAAVRARLERLVALEQRPHGAALLEDVRARHERFAPAVEVALASAAADPPRRGDAERALSDARDDLLGAVRAYSARQDQQTLQARREIGAAVRRLDRGLLLLAPMVVVLLAVTAILTMRSVRRPALRLLAAARALEAGDDGAALALAGAPAPAGRRDELAGLSAAFGSMAAALRARSERLREQNEALRAQGEELRETLEARRRAEEALRDANARKDEFLATLSHELRNPLAPLRNGLYLLERAPPGSDAARRARAAMDRQVRHLTRLVDDLLDVARIARGKVELRKVAVNLGRIVDEVAGDVREQFEASGLDLRVSLPAQPLWVNGDPARLAQIAGNLLHNALKFTPPGGRVELALEEAAGGGALLRVRDTGVGMERALLERIFEPFVQGDATLARTSGGLGLGLALVKALSAYHGGTVEARSDGPGTGAELVVRLPLAPEPPHAGSPSAPGPVAARRLLVVEDNVDAAETLAELLRLDGHEVAVARDGEEALRSARELRPDAVLCDIGLPGMTGYDVARAMRADGALGGTVLVALTGYAREDDRRRGADAGFDEYLAKPLTRERLQEVLARVPPRGVPAPAAQAVEKT